MKKKISKKRWVEMTVDELAAATVECDQEFIESESKPLSTTGRLLWERARRSRKSFKSLLLVDVDPKLASRARNFASRNGVTVDDVVARGLNAVLVRSK